MSYFSLSLQGWKNNLPGKQLRFFWSSSAKCISSWNWVQTQFSAFALVPGLLLNSLTSTPAFAGFFWDRNKSIPVTTCALIFSEWTMHSGVAFGLWYSVWPNLYTTMPAELHVVADLFMLTVCLTRTSGSKHCSSRDIFQKAC